MRRAHAVVVVCMSKDSVWAREWLDWWWEVVVEGEHPITESRNIYASSQNQRELVWSKTAGAEGLSPAFPKVFILPRSSRVKGCPWGAVVCWAHAGVQLPVEFHPKEIKTPCSEMDLWRKPQQRKGVKLRDLFPYALLIQAAVLM